MTLVLIFIVAVIMYRVLVSIPLFKNTTTRPRAQIIASLSAAVVNLILIMALGRVYEKLALKMTQWGTLVFISDWTFKLLKQMYYICYICLVNEWYNYVDYYGPWSQVQILTMKMTLWGTRFIIFLQYFYIKYWNNKWIIQVH